MAAKKTVLVTFLLAHAALNAEVGTQMELTQDDAKPLIDAGIAQVVQDAPKSKASKRDVLLLVDQAAGKCGQIVSVDDDVAKQMVKDGTADDNAKALAAHVGNQARFEVKEKAK